MSFEIAWFAPSCWGDTARLGVGDPERRATFDYNAKVVGLADRLGLRRRMIAVGNTRSIGKADMPENTASPEIRVEPDTFRVWVDGDEIEPAPARELPMAQRYFLF